MGSDNKCNSIGRRYLKPSVLNFTIKKMKNSSPYGIWRKLKTPNPNNHNLSRFCNSNLFILKDENQKFGI